MLEKNPLSPPDEKYYAFTAHFQGPDSAASDLIALDVQKRRLLVGIAGSAGTLLDQQRPESGNEITKAFDPAIRLNTVNEIDGVEQLGSLICQDLQNRLYGIPLVVDKSHIYRQLVTTREDVIHNGSWQWHVDGHPAEYVKVLIYLSDVDDNASCFQVFWSDSRQRAMRTPAARMSDSNWTPGEARRGRYVEETDLERIRNKGYATRTLTGPAFSLAVFNTNCVHRGTVGRKSTRDTLLYRIRPVTSSEQEYDVNIASYRTIQQDALL